MWKKGEELVLRDKTTLPFNRFLFNVGGSLLSAFCIYQLLSNYTSIEEVQEGIVRVLAYAGIALISIYGIYLSYFPDQTTIVIGEEGIKVGNPISYAWTEVTHAYYGGEETSFAEDLGRAIQRRMEGSRGNRKKSWFLHVLHKQGSEIVHSQHKLDRYSYDSNEIKRAIEYWSGRDIGDKEDLQRDQYIDRLIVEERISREDAEQKRQRIAEKMPLFKELSSSMSVVMLKMFLASMLLFPLLYFGLFKMEVHGFTSLAQIFYGSVIGPIILAVAIASKKNEKMLAEFRQSDELSDLTKDEFDECAKIAKVKGDDSSITDRLLEILVDLLLAAWILLLLYTALTKFGVL